MHLNYIIVNKYGLLNFVCLLYMSIFIDGHFIMHSDSKYEQYG